LRDIVVRQMRCSNVTLQNVAAPGHCCVWNCAGRKMICEEHLGIISFTRFPHLRLLFVFTQHLPFNSSTLLYAQFANVTALNTMHIASGASQLICQFERGSD